MSDDEPVWSTEEPSENTLKIGTTTHDFQGPIEAQDIAEKVREAGMSDFRVYEADGTTELKPDEAPFDKDIVVKDYNESSGE